MAALRHPGVAQVYDYGEVSLRRAGPRLHRDGVRAGAAPVGADRRGRPAGRGRDDVDRRADRPCPPGRPRRRGRPPGRQAQQPDHRAGRARRTRRFRRRGDAGGGEPDRYEPGRRHRPVHGPGADLEERDHTRRSTSTRWAPSSTTASPAGRRTRARTPSRWRCGTSEEEPRRCPRTFRTAVRRLVATAMAKEPAHRFPTAAAMATAAQAVAGPSDRVAPDRHRGDLDRGARRAAGCPALGPRRRGAAASRAGRSWDHRARGAPRIAGRRGCRPGVRRSHRDDDGPDRAAVDASRGAARGVANGGAAGGARPRCRRRRTRPRRDPAGLPVRASGSPTPTATGSAGGAAAGPPVGDARWGRCGYARAHHVRECPG